MKLTKQDIDKVRHIEGFPIAKDEDIIALSRPPYYTACPNPFIEDFIREHGTPYDEATDDYHREPFAADVSEGKNDPIYNAHSYHTKVPYKAIMRYILHYTKPGDIVFDGFCGTGMTGVAAQICGSPDPAFKAQIETEMKDSHIRWGARKAILNDLSPAATFIAYNYNTPVDVDAFEREAKRILAECEKELGWMYETQHVDEKGMPVLGLDGKPITGHINYTVWSDVFVCPTCSNEVIFWDAAVDKRTGKVNESFCCDKCNSVITKRDSTRAQETIYDDVLKRPSTHAKQVPVFINYSVGNREYERPMIKYDFRIMSGINATTIPQGFPCMELPNGFNTEQPRKSHGIDYIHQFYTRRNLIALSTFWSKVQHDSVDEMLKVHLFAIATGVMQGVSKLQRFRLFSTFPNMILSGTLYIGSVVREWNPLNWMSGKLKSLVKMHNSTRKFGDNSIITTMSSTEIEKFFPGNSIDYIFTDPPFGGNLNYSELSSIWESWLQVITNNQEEAIINEVQKKQLPEYQTLMQSCFAQYYRILKPGHWITIEFHNSKNSVWNVLTESLVSAGFVVADTRILDKQQGSFKQIVHASAVKQDLVISAYKPKDSFVKDFQRLAGAPEMAWEFVRQHLEKVPVIADGNKDGMLDLIAERCDYLLFDRMVAYHIIHGISVPMDAHTFYDGLRQRFLERDSMFFLPDQVTAYDEKRMHMDLDTTQFSFVVTDEKNAIQWLNYILKDKPQTYQDIQPQYLQELHKDKREQMPELLDMLKDNFLQDEQGRFYIPDLSKAADLAKLRIKKLLKEFYDSYVPGKAKLKAFRMEAIRAGFDDCWNKRDYKAIINVGERLPEEVLQEDPALLMYYDNACVRK